MSECGQRAVLVVTRGVEGTSTAVARRRIELTCRLAPRHSGEHHDAVHGERWQAVPGQKTTLLRHEEDEA
jgi:hypothetical protein